MTEISEKELIENLLKPRIKCIAPYPNSPFGDNSILNLQKDGMGMWYYKWVEYDGFEKMYESEFLEYPHLFKRLEWHEERQESEMPKYVKFIKKYMDYKESSVFKFENWGKQFENGLIPFRYKKGEYGLSAVPPHFNQLMPATSEEYLSFINQNKQQ